jgi:hypothetical protein
MNHHPTHPPRAATELITLCENRKLARFPIYMIGNDERLGGELENDTESQSQACEREC